MTPRQLSLINKKSQRVVEPGWFTIAVGGKLPDDSDDIQSSRFKINDKSIQFEK
jgi:beta-glucosidase